MAHDMNNPSAVDTQAPISMRRRFVLTSDETIKGQEQPGHTEPAGVMFIGPFAQKVWTIRYREIAETASSVRLAATYALDVLQLAVSSTTPLTPYNVYTDATTTWETVATTSVAKNGMTTVTVDWSNAGLSQNTVPTAVRFYFNVIGSAVRVEIEDGIL